MKWQTTHKEAHCPKCQEFSVFHKEIAYGTGTIEQYPCGKPVWQCGLCDHIMDRRIKAKAFNTN